MQFEHSQKTQDLIARAEGLWNLFLPDGDDYVITGRKWWISGAMRSARLLRLESTRSRLPTHGARLV